MVSDPHIQIIPNHHLTTITFSRAGSENEWKGQIPGFLLRKSIVPPVSCIDEPPFFKLVASLTPKEARSCTTPPPPPELGIRNHGVVSEPWSKGEERREGWLIWSTREKLLCLWFIACLELGGITWILQEAARVVQSTHPEGLQARKILEMKNDQLLWLKSKWWILEKILFVYLTK